MPVSLDVAVIIAIVAVLAIVAAAALFGGAKKEPVVVCPRCRTRLFSRRCLVCNWPAATMAEKRTLESLTAVREQIQRYAGLGLMDCAACDRLLESLEAERRQWVAPAARADRGCRTCGATFDCGGKRSAAATVASPEKAAQEVSGSAQPVIAASAPAADGDELRCAPRRLWRSNRRARQFVERQAAAAANVAVPVVPAATRPHALAGATGSTRSAARTPAAPRRPVFDLLSAFLEEQNIRWGELIGGLLIVGCSIALVISFWAKIAERPFLKFFVFNGVTAAMFGLGLYAAHRWKLCTDQPGRAADFDSLGAAEFFSDRSIYRRDAVGADIQHGRRGDFRAAICRACTAAGESDAAQVWLLVIGGLCLRCWNCSCGVG